MTTYRFWSASSRGKSEHDKRKKRINEKFVPSANGFFLLIKSAMVRIPLQELPVCGASKTLLTPNPLTP
jgi:hypothetical protein